MFKAVEGDSGSTEKSNAGLRLKKLKEDVTKNYNMSEDEFDVLVWQIQQVNSSSAGPEWNYRNTLSFIIQLLTTIGKNATILTKNMYGRGHLSLSSLKSSPTFLLYNPAKLHVTSPQVLNYFSF